MSKAKKRKNPPDATLRNVRAANRRLEKIEAELRRWRPLLRRLETANRKK